MKKRIFMALLAAVSTFAMVSCDEDKDNDPNPSGTVVADASWGEEGNTVWLSIPIDEIPTSMGSATEKTVWEFNSGDLCTTYYSVTTCSNAALAQSVYEEALNAMNNPEPADDGEEPEVIDDVKIKGNDVYVYYKVEEQMTKQEVIRGAKLAVAMMNADPTDIFGGLTDEFGDLSGFEDESEGFGEIIGEEE